MSDKCKWEVGKLHTCIESTGLFVIGVNGMFLQYGVKSRLLSFCPFCGADIRKPEPEVIIRKSGGTYSALISNKHCLCIMPDVYEHLKGKVTPERMLEDGIFKPISEIEITDEIAKLNPICVFSNEINLKENMEKIVAFNGKDFAIEYKTPMNFSYGSMPAEYFERLAIVSDLEGRK